MIIGPLLMLGLFVFPLWNITLEAPQYPKNLGMNIHINKFTDVQEFDIKNINLMNHYVGMKYIPETIPEFTIFPIVIGIMVLLGVLIGFFANYKWFLAWFVIMTLLEYDYGHNLDPKAIMSFKNPDGSPMGFQPPLFGTKLILNFVAHSYPRLGAYMMFSGMLLTLGAFFMGKREAQNEA